MRHFLLFVVSVILSVTAHAQGAVDLSSNIDSQPIWGPTGFDYVEYYYLPDIDTYYDVARHSFSYYERGYWISRPVLPLRNREYDLFNGYKVVVNEPTPYRKSIINRDKYSPFKGRHDQPSIRDSRDSKYFVNANHPEHYNWVKQQRRDGDTSREKRRGNTPGQD